MYFYIFLKIFIYLFIFTKFIADLFKQGDTGHKETQQKIERNEEQLKLGKQDEKRQSHMRRAPMNVRRERRRNFDILKLRRKRKFSECKLKL